MTVRRRRRHAVDPASGHAPDEAVAEHLASKKWELSLLNTYLIWGNCASLLTQCGGGTSTGGTTAGGDNVYYEWLVTASLQDIIDWLDMMGYWPE